MHAARTRKLAIAAAIAVPTLALAGVGADAPRDRASAGRARSEIARARDALAARSIDDAARGVRAAAVELQPVLDGPWPRHAWSRTAGRGGVEELRADLARAVADLEAAIESRRAGIAALESMRADVGYATTIAQLDAVESRRTAAVTELEREAPAGHADLVAAIGARRRSFEADVDRNRAAVAALARSRERARGDVQALQSIADAVLPAPARADEATALDALRSGAAAERAALLAEVRLGAAREEAAAATTSAAVAEIADRVAADPDLVRGDAGLAERRESTIGALRKRERDLARWERSVSGIDSAFAAAEFGAAARALARLAPCDARTGAEADRVRSAFGARAVEEFVRAAVAALDRSEPEALDRMSAPFAPGGAVRPTLDADALRTADEVRAKASRALDRLLYEQFRRSPSPQAADRYLEGWPAVRRAMAPAVLEWRRASAESATELSIEEIQWGALGLATVTRRLEDRPDARVMLLVNGTPSAELRIGDIREDGVNGLNDVMVSFRGFPSQDLEVGIAAIIDLRDAILSDPRPRGTVRQPVSAWRAARREPVAFADPSWSGCRHVAMIRASVPKTPPLPPFQGRQQ